MARLYDVPTDVVQFVIFPYLDKESRFIANDVLHPSRQIEYRFPSRIPENDRIRHALNVSGQVFAKLLKGSQTRPFSAKNIINIFRKLLKGDGDILLQYNRAFREETYKKMFQFIDMDYSGYTFISKGIKKGLINLSTKIIQRLDKIPYIRHVSQVYAR